MRSLYLTPEAERGLARQVDYLLDVGSIQAAETLLQRVERFLETTLLEWPRTGRLIPERAIWESWIPHTQLIVWHIFDDHELTVIAVWHAAQDRQSF